MSNNKGRISSDQIVSSGYIVLKKGDPLIEKMNPNKIIIIDNDAASLLKQEVTPYDDVVSIGVDASDLDITRKDAPDLSDITVYTPVTRKQAAGNKEIYYEIVFKVRNSSERKNQVIGVDARIVGTEPEND